MSMCALMGVVFSGLLRFSGHSTASGLRVADRVSWGGRASLSPGHF